MDNKLYITANGSTSEVNPNSSYNTVGSSRFSIKHYINYTYDYYTNKFRIWVTRDTEVTTSTNYTYRTLIKINNETILDETYSLNSSSSSTSQVKEIDCNFDGSMSNIPFYLSTNFSSVDPSSSDMYFSSNSILTSRLKINNTWKNIISYIKCNGVWKKCIIWKKISGVWKKEK